MHIQVLKYISFKNVMFLCFLTGLSLLEYSCNNLLDEIDTVEINKDGSNWAIPLINSKTNLKNLFNRLGKSTSIIIYPDGRISFYYSGNVLSKKSTDVVDILRNVIYPISSPHDTIIPPDLDQLIRKAYIVGDTLIFRFRPDTNAIIDIEALMPNMMDVNGQAFSIKGQYDGSGEIILKKSMNGYTIYPVDSVGFEVAYNATYLDGSSALIEDALLAFREMRFSYVEGYFSKDEYDVPADTIDIDLFQNWTKGGVYFKDPRISVTIDNSFGFPVRTSIKEMKVVSRGGNEVAISSPQIDSGVYISYPTLDEVGQSKRDSFYFDKNNSNIDLVFNANPVQLIYDIDGIGNPDQDKTITGFATDSSRFIINVEVELPADGWVDQFLLTDTIDIIGDVSTLDAKSASIKTIINNGFPVGLNTQFYLLENQQIIDTLFSADEWVLKAAIVGAKGKVISARRSEQTLDLSSLNIENLNRADQILVRMSISTSNAPTQSVLISSLEEIEVKMGILINY